MRLVPLLLVALFAARAVAGVAEDDEKKFLAVSTKYAKANPHEQPGLKYPVPKIVKEKPTKGDVGVYAADADHFTVAAVVDAHTLVIVPVTADKPPLNLPAGSLGSPQDVGAAMQQAILDQAANTKYKAGTPFYLITQKKTDKVEVGQKGKPGLCEVVGTKEYKTDAGEKTDIVVLRELDVTKIDRHLKERSNRK